MYVEGMCLRALHTKSLSCPRSQVAFFHIRDQNNRKCGTVQLYKDCSVDKENVFLTSSLQKIYDNSKTNFLNLIKSWFEC